MTRLLLTGAVLMALLAVRGVLGDGQTLARERGAVVGAPSESPGDGPPGSWLLPNGKYRIIGVTPGRTRETRSWPGVRSLGNPWARTPWSDLGSVSLVLVAGRELFVQRGFYAAAQVGLDDGSTRPHPGLSQALWFCPLLPLYGPACAVIVVRRDGYVGSWGEDAWTSMAVPARRYPELRLIASTRTDGDAHIEQADMPPLEDELRRDLAMLQPALSVSEYVAGSETGDDYGISDKPFTGSARDVFLLRADEDALLLRMPREARISWGLTPGRRGADGNTPFFVQEYVRPTQERFDLLGRYAGRGYTKVTIAERQCLVDLEPVFAPSVSGDTIRVSPTGMCINRRGTFLLSVMTAVRGQWRSLAFEVVDGKRHTPVLDLPLRGMPVRSLGLGRDGDPQPRAWGLDHPPPPAPVAVWATPEGEIVFVDAHGNAYVSNPIEAVRAAVAE
jgi:hypothetical protein